MSEITDLQTKSNESFTLRVITPTSVRRFKKLFHGCISLLDELIITVDSNGLCIRQPDCRNTAFVDCTFSPKFFRGFEFQSEDSAIQLSINPREFMNSIQQASTAVIIDFSSQNSDTLRIKAVGRSSISNKIKVLPISQFQRTPKFDVLGSFTLIMRTLYDILLPFKNRTNGAKLTIHDGEESQLSYVSIEIYTEDGTLSNETLQNSNRIWNVEINESLIVSHYDIDYLLKGLSLFIPDDRITISMANNKPLTISSNGLDGRKINFTLAPRVPRTQ